MSHMVFLVLLVMTLVAGFQVLGTLMVVGIMMLPAASARFWSGTVVGQMIVASVLGALASYLGLLFSFYANVPASAAIILLAGLFYFLSIVLGRTGGLWQAARQMRARRRQLHPAGS
jgi:zinc/manganese transport system permease protein